MEKITFRRIQDLGFSGKFRFGLLSEEPVEGLACDLKSRVYRRARLRAEASSRRTEGPEDEGFEPPSGRPRRFSRPLDYHYPSPPKKSFKYSFVQQLVQG